MRCTSAVQNTRNESSTGLCIRESSGTQLQQLTFTKHQRESASVQRTSDSGRYLFIHWAGGGGGGGAVRAGLERMRSWIYTLAEIQASTIERAIRAASLDG